MVTALGAINTDNPNITADISSEVLPGQSTGRADPVAIPVKINAKGMPDAWRANIGRQIIGEMQMLNPRSIQTNVIKV